MGQEVILLPLFDYKGRILTETDLATNVKSEYTYDSLSRVTKRKVTNLSDNSVTEENYTYDANGNILSTAVNTDNDSFVYDANNRLTEYNGQAILHFCIRSQHQQVLF